ncbi:MAG TPA: preprotein translocase subunit YajC [Opitutaceae bacterium]|jgi:preprotein translocase subunit YajC|nr:preprotein translocase subunit YajC [Opitutaceae bacterium]
MTQTLTLILAQQTAAPAAQPQGGSGLMMLLVYGLFAAGMYFLLFAPQRKKQKELATMISALATGDEVVTTGGIYGVIAAVKPDRFVVRIADNTKIEVGKGFIQAVVNKDSDAKSK